MRRKNDSSPSICNENPSQIMNVYWLFAERKQESYLQTSENSGKWLIFVPIAQVDNIWSKIKSATEEGRLGHLTKVATAKTNPNASDSATKVICVYTYDWADKEDVMRIRQELRQLGIIWKIPYKADEDTESGRYANRGTRHISKYYV